MPKQAKGNLNSSIEKIGYEIINCRESCKGLRNNQDEGYYPRSFFLEPQNATTIKAVVVGLNPGYCGRLEREFYKFAAEMNAEKGLKKHAIYEDCTRIWRAVSEGNHTRYFHYPRHFLEEVGVLKNKPPNNSILWTEVAFCENDQEEGKKDYRKCSSKFLKRIFDLEKFGYLKEGTCVLCLGEEAFNLVCKIDNSKKLKVVGIYHPTGARIFANYFEKSDAKKNAKIDERKIDEHVRKEFCQVRKGEPHFLKLLKKKNSEF
jgi:hypothetical protein